jgi:hypothetical protein
VYICIGTSFVVLIGRPSYKNSNDEERKEAFHSSTSDDKPDVIERQNTNENKTRCLFLKSSTEKQIDQHVNIL